MPVRLLLAFCDHNAANEWEGVTVVVVAAFFIPVRQPASCGREVFQVLVHWSISLNMPGYNNEILTLHSQPALPCCMLCMVWLYTTLFVLVIPTWRSDLPSYDWRNVAWIGLRRHKHFSWCPLINGLQMATDASSGFLEPMSYWQKGQHCNTLKLQMYFLEWLNVIPDFLSFEAEKPIWPYPARKSVT